MVVDDSGAAEFAAQEWVWIPEGNGQFVKGYIVKDGPGNPVVDKESGKTLVRCGNKDKYVDSVDLAKVNPPKFHKARDIAELTYLNEPSVLHNLSARYSDDLIYTYSGIFLVAVNPYARLPIYSEEAVKSYRNSKRQDCEPHIFALTDHTYSKMVKNKENQSILITGESGAGKTENTKKVIQYLTSITSGAGDNSLETQILQANPILEAFGNAQTVKNNNSSRFGKFIRLQFSARGNICGASIDWYLLEKSRVTKQNPKERNYHVFYQLLAGCNAELRQELLLGDDEGVRSLAKFEYLKHSKFKIEGVDDKKEFQSLLKAFSLMNFKPEDQSNIFRVLAGILHLGNIRIAGEKSNQARLENSEDLEKACHVLGLPSADELSRTLLHPKVKAGREWVVQHRTADQVRAATGALAKALYERLFRVLVDSINDNLVRSQDSSSFIGVLDIAGFEIFHTNSFEQLCINYTNEKLQQFFNHYVFVLEQEEYAREQIEWKYIDFGNDLQPTIDLIEKNSPVGIFSCLDEECVVPNGSDASFAGKLTQIWQGKTDKFLPNKFAQGFTVAHYAGRVDYSADGWVDKNKDALSENLVEVVLSSSHKFVRKLFKDDMLCLPEGSDGQGQTRRKPTIRTVAQRHKEQLNQLMNQLNETTPSFVRCIVPNREKKPRKFVNQLVLDQLRCNGVLEGIRIARSGFPNRIPFASFKARYSCLQGSAAPRGFTDSRKACEMILRSINLDQSLYMVGLTKLFFKNGVLAELEATRDQMITQSVSQLQNVARACLVRRKVAEQLRKIQAAKLIAKCLKQHEQLEENKWWSLYVKLKPMVYSTRANGMPGGGAHLKKLEKKLSSLQESHEKLKLDHKKKEMEVQKLQARLVSQEELLADKEALIERQAEHEVLSRRKLAALQQQLSDLLKEKESLESCASSEVAETKEMFERQVEELKKQLAAEKKSKADISAALRKETTSIQESTSSLKEEIRKLKSDLRKAESDLQALQDKQSLAETEKQEPRTPLGTKPDWSAKDNIANSENPEFSQKPVSQTSSTVSGNENLKAAKSNSIIQADHSDLLQAKKECEQLKTENQQLHLRLKELSQRWKADIEKRDQLAAMATAASSESSANQNQSQNLNLPSALKSESALALKCQKLERQLQMMIATSLPAASRRSQLSVDLRGDETNTEIRNRLLAERRAAEPSPAAVRTPIRQESVPSSPAKESGPMLTRSATVFDVMTTPDRSTAGSALSGRLTGSPTRSKTVSPRKAGSDLQLEVEHLRNRNEELQTSLKLYKERAADFYSRLEAAELAILKTQKTEKLFKAQLKDLQLDYKHSEMERKEYESKAMELSNQIRSLQQLLDDRDSKLEKLLQENEFLRQQLQEENSKSVEAEVSSQASISNLQSELAKTKDIVSEREKTIEQLSREADERNTELLTLKELQSSQYEQIQKLQTVEVELRKEVSELRVSIAKREQTVQEKAGLIASLDEQISDLTARTGALSTERDTALDLKRELEKKLADMQEKSDAERRKLTEEAGKEASRVLQLQTELEKQKLDYQTVKGKLMEGAKLLTQTRDQLDELKKNKFELETAKSITEAELQDSQNKCQALEKHIEELKQQLAQADRNGEIAQLQEDLSQKTQACQDAEARIKQLALRLKELEDKTSMKSKDALELAQLTKKQEERIRQLLQDVETLQSSETQLEVDVKRLEREKRELYEASLQLQKESQEWQERCHALTLESEPVFL